MIIDCISDLHGYYPKLEGGDLLIVAGDLTARHTLGEFQQFKEWVDKQNYKKKIVIAGNHDNFCVPYEIEYPGIILDGRCPYYEYLCDSGTEFEGLKIWGSPWTLKFPGMNPHCMAFTCETEEELAEKWALIPDDTDILITHSPPLAIFDRNVDGQYCGSPSLCGLLGHLNLKLHVFGHIHECGGSIQYPVKQDGLPNYFDFTNTIFVNASHVNEHYQSVNKPVRVIL
jgi:Icc-related predicted phosphoesterase